MNEYCHCCFLFFHSVFCGPLWFIAMHVQRFWNGNHLQIMNMDWYWNNCLLAKLFGSFRIKKPRTISFPWVHACTCTLQIMLSNTFVPNILVDSKNFDELKKCRTFFPPKSTSPAIYWKSSKTWAILFITLWLFCNEFVLDLCSFLFHKQWIKQSDCLSKWTQRKEKKIKPNGRKQNHTK